MQNLQLNMNFATWTTFYSLVATLTASPIEPNIEPEDISDSQEIWHGV